MVAFTPCDDYLRPGTSQNTGLLKVPGRTQELWPAHIERIAACRCAYSVHLGTVLNYVHLLRYVLMAHLRASDRTFRTWAEGLKVFAGRMQHRPHLRRNTFGSMRTYHQPSACDDDI
jgi:hypothetical protein